MMQTNALYFGDNLKVLSERLPDGTFVFPSESVDLVYTGSAVQLEPRLQPDLQGTGRGEGRCADPRVRRLVALGRDSQGHLRGHHYD